MSYPRSVAAAYSTLDPEIQKAFRKEYGAGKKSTLLAYLFWFFLGFHYLYMGRVGMQLAFWFTGGGFLIWWIIDFFRVPGIVSNHNNDRARTIMAQIKQMG